MSLHLGNPAPGILDRLGCRVLGLLAQGPGGAIEPLVGSPPSAEIEDAARAMAASPGPARPGARTLAQGHLVRVPLADGAAHLWWIEAEAGGRATLTAATIKALVGASGRLASPSATAKAAGPASTSTAAQPRRDDVGTRLLEALAALPRTSRRRRLRQMLDALGQATGWTNVAAIELRGTRVRRVTMLEARPGAKAPSLEIFARRQRAQGRRFLAATPAGEVELSPALGPDQQALPGLAEAPASFNASAAQTDDPADPGPDLALYCSEHGLERFAMALPAGDGIGLYAEGTSDRLGLECAVNALALSFARQRRSARPWLARTAIAALAAGVVAFLALPAPFEIGAPGELRPANAEVVVVPHEARLVDLPVRVGERVGEGAVLARFASSELEEAEARAALDQLLEGLSAQEALAAGDYARYQLAEQRREIAALKAEQGRRRQAELTVLAPAAGRVADLLPRSQLGALLSAGTVIGEVEHGERMQAVLQLAASDGPHVRAGMSGTIVVRGLVDRSYELRLLEDPLLHEREDGSETLTVLGEIEAPASSELFKGLTGFARLDAGEMPRGLILIRPITDYLRLFLWQHLGLRL